MKRILIIIGVLMALVAFLIPAVPAPAADGPLNAPRIHVKDGTSTNWSGYAVETNLASPANNVVADVFGSWIVPPVTTSGYKYTYSSAWIGIDGYSSNSVEQIGTEQDWSDGRPVYSAWYEMYPKMSQTIKNFSVSPGDIITGEVQYNPNNGNFTLTLINKTTGKSFSTSQKANRALRSSAEWIMEAPWSGGVLPLANFGTVNFSGASATLNGHKGNVLDPAWNSDRIDMVNSNGATKAQTVSTIDGTSFSVNFVSSN